MLIREMSSIILTLSKSVTQCSLCPSPLPWSLSPCQRVSQGELRPRGSWELSVPKFEGLCYNLSIYIKSVSKHYPWITIIKPVISACSQNFQLGSRGAVQISQIHPLSGTLECWSLLEVQLSGFEMVSFWGGGVVNEIPFLNELFHGTQPIERSAAAPLWSRGLPCTITTDPQDFPLLYNRWNWAQKRAGEVRTAPRPPVFCSLVLSPCHREAVGSGPERAVDKSRPLTF